MTVATMTLAPKLSTDEAKQKAPVMDLLGSWTTHYQSSAHNGFSANITIPRDVSMASSSSPARCSTSGRPSAR